jgi:uncharacterized protein (DUF1778 family)
MQTAPLKAARMELKTTHDAKELLNQAATLDGMDLTSFVLGSAIERARKVLSDHAIIALSKSGQATLAGLLAKPPKPTEAMTQLMSLPDFPARKA